MYTDEENRKTFEEEERERQGGKGKLILLLICIIVFLGLLVVILLPSLTKEETPKITIANKALTLDAGKTVKIEYTFNKKVNPTFKSSDEKIATVDATGVVTGIDKGTVVVTLIFNYKNKEYVDKVNVTVNKEETDDDPTDDPGNNSGNNSGKVKKNVTLTYSIEGNKDLNKWQTTAVVINVTAANHNKLVYAVDCSGTCDYKTVEGNRIIFGDSGTHKITIEASNSSGSSKKEEITVKIDTTPPTCQLAYQGGNITLTTDDNGSGLAYYGESSSYTGAGSKTKTGTAGTHTFYVSDAAGNKNSCTIKLVNKTQYRSRSCSACKTCKAAGCAESWTSSSAGCHTNPNGQKASCSTGGCSCSGTGINTCTSCNCKRYNANCGTCGGCSTWGNWSAWQDAAITSSGTKEVQTQNVLVVG